MCKIVRKANKDHSLEQDILSNGRRKRLSWFADVGPAWKLWVEEEADREGILGVMNGSSQSIIQESLGMWKG